MTLHSAKSSRFPGARRDTVQEAKRRATVDVLIRAAQEGMSARGLDVTVDDVANVAGVSRSTMFRYFSSRDELIAAAIRTGAEQLEQTLPPYQGGDWQQWLRRVCDAVHARAAATSRGVWDLSGRHDLSPQLADAVADLVRNRRKRHRALASTLWTAAGGDGSVPTLIEHVVATHLSPLFTMTVLTDVDANAVVASRLSATCITHAVHDELRRTSEVAGMNSADAEREDHVATPP